MTLDRLDELRPAEQSFIARTMTETDLNQETAFSLLADETRVRILTELGAATASPETGIPRLSYADLKSRVALRDSGHFNYH